MKKFLLFIFPGLFFLQIAVAQRSAGFITEDRLFLEGKAMYENGNYAGCMDKIAQYRKRSSDRELLLESDFLHIACLYHTGNEAALLALKEYLDRSPQNIHRNEIAFMIGSLHFSKKEYELAAYWFNQADLDLLSVGQQEDYAYRMGISNLKSGKIGEAKRLFGLLSRNSEKYRDESTYYLAYLHYGDKEYAEALKLFERIKDKPTFKEDVTYYLTQIAFAQGRYTQTITEGKKLLSLYPGNSYNPEINRIIGISYFQEEDYRAAIEYIGKAADTSGQLGREDFYTLGLACYFEKRYPEAIRYLSQSNPANDEMGQSTYLHLAQSYLKTSDSRNALMAFQSASRMDFDPQAKESALYNYAMLLHQNSVSAFGESVTILENFLNTYPNSMYADKVNDALVDVYLTTKSYDTALASMAKIRQPGSKILEARQKIYYYLGTVDFTNGDYDRAIGHFTQAVDAGNYARSEKEEALYWRGESWYKKGDYVRAASDFKAFGQTGNRTGNLQNMTRYNLAYCAFNQKQYPAAETSFRSFIQASDGKSAIVADAYARLGDCLFNNRRFTDAEEAYNQAVRISPTQGAYALFQKGYVMGLQKDYRGKIAQMDKLIAEYPESPYVTDAYYEKGRSFVLLENTPAAIATYQTLWEKFPESSAARNAGLQIGMLYFNSDQPQKAAEAYKKVVSKYPGSPEARVAVQDLKSVYFDLNDINGYAEYVRGLGGGARFDVTEQDSLTYFAAERFFMRGDTKQAQENLIRYLQSFPEGAFQVNARYYLANTYYQEKNFTKAKPEYQAVLSIGNTQFTEPSVARLAEIEFNNKNYEAALPLYERLLGMAESKTNKNAGALGVLRSSARLSSFPKMITSANVLLSDESQEPGVVTEAKYYRAIALLALGEDTQAESDLTTLAKDTRTAFGAEAKFLLAQHYFGTARTAKAKETIQDYIKQGTPHSYWLARSFILLSDIYKSEDDNLQARQYLESLQNSYTNPEEDIREMISERLKQLN